VVSEQLLVDIVTESLQSSTSQVHKQSLCNKVSDSSHYSKQFITSTYTSTDHQIALGDNVTHDKAVSFVDISQPGQFSKEAIIDLTLSESENFIDLTVKKSTSTEHFVAEEYKKVRRNSRLFRRRPQPYKRSSESHSSVTEIQMSRKGSAWKKSNEKYTSPNLCSRKKRKSFSTDDDNITATSEFEYTVRRFCYRFFYLKI
jgi:hypothetical protein